MTKIMCALTAAITLITGVWLHAQESNQASSGPASTSGETKRKSCQDMCVMKGNSTRTGHLLAWRTELNLTEEQRVSLSAIENVAASKAKDLLTPEQQAKLEELSKTPIMQCMRAVKHGHSASEIGPAGCAEMQGKPKEAHPSH
jgi:Spy/CpxP family protein refolding chaperone